MGTSLSILKLRRRKMLSSRTSGEDEKERNMLDNGGMLLEELLHSCDGKYNPFRIFSAKEIANATNNYHELFMDYGYSQMYKGSFNGRQICVKSFNSEYVMDGNAIGAAINEIVFASQLNNHNNILMLLGCCLETKIPKLVYEYAENGDLSNHIFKSYRESNNHEQLLRWDCRLKVAKEISDALAYLHTRFSMPIIHRDVRPINIYLDGNYVAKLSDFSLSVSIPLGEEYVEIDNVEEMKSEYMLQGSTGYIAPECISIARVTEKFDVYSFGSLLIEILSAERMMSSDLGQINQLESILASCGACNFVKGVEEASNNPNPDFVASNQRATTSFVQSSAFSMEEGKPRLHEFMIETAKKYMGPADIMLEDQWKLSMAWTLASKCRNFTPEERPTMKEVAQEIRKIIRFQCNST